MSRFGGRAALIALSLVLVGCGDDGAPTVEDDGPTGSQSPGAQRGDHWHAAFGVQVCGELLEPVADARKDRTGLHSHSDGLIHIHPFNDRSSGDGANLAAFFDTVAYSVTDEKLTTPDDQFDTEEGCGGEPATIRLLVDGEEHEGEIEDFIPRDGQILQLLFDSPDAEPIELPWAESVRSPGDVQAIGDPGTV